MTFYIQLKDKTDPLRNIPIAEFNIHSFDIYWKVLSDTYEFSEYNTDDDPRFDEEEGYIKTDFYNKDTGEIILTMKNTTIDYFNSQDYELVIEDA